ncbi:malto-oligosyltrehalose trehalohydrolase [Devosia oryziradicis]|uniref:Malto-oligosyltrehalose trehalohydrolase n=1 Tax=Devosia oryziradicis TaxID=2801335 RepID=A0ABX7BSS5_9HYPH|nr:alpha-amylase family glycosyl hydrolase [Devosia oryziradicis]QQR34836.1 malto-oligosyltrehalose trehalohydrolase [Devosia oryziradicis]
MDYRFGALADAEATTFRLWAPSANAVSVVFKDGDPVPLRRVDEGFLEAVVPSCPPGTAYMFRIDGKDVPDPASRQQESDSDGWSLVTTRLTPTGRDEPLRPWSETLLCEVHVGTASPEGTFAGLMRRLEHFRDAGYNALEIMPVNEFPGNRGWGYDGTLIFAPEAAYGTRDDLRALVDRAHELGLCLILDVVYNHFGDEQNFMKDYAPEWFDPEVETPWGPGIDFTQPMVRQFYYENACMWLSEFDFDGLRFDSVHEMKTEARELFLTELAATARKDKRGAKLIVENMKNIASLLERDENDEPLKYSAQWNDDIHHVLNFLVTGEDMNGYEDTSRDAIADLEKALADGFVHDGEAGDDSGGYTRNEPASRLPPDAFVSFVQNHDQIGNRADAKRLPDRIGADKLDFLHFVVMLAPQIPLFFMGEEAHVTSPFPYFIDMDKDVSQAKSDDRYKQMREIFKQDVKDGDLPDPNDIATFQSAKYPWGELGRQDRRDAMRRFQTLAGYRLELVCPLLQSVCLDAKSTRHGSAIIVNWVFEKGTLSMALNPADHPTDIGCVITAAPVSSGEFSQHGEVLRLAAWSAVVWASPERS